MTLEEVGIVSHALHKVHINLRQRTQQIAHLLIQVLDSSKPTVGVASRCSLITECKFSGLFELSWVDFIYPLFP